ncbi:hypothetical protein GN956_G16530 [Arapaima gigas]
MDPQPICVEQFLSDPDQARAVEDAVRAAVHRVLEVFWAANEQQLRAMRAAMAETERENRKLRVQMETAERELLSLRSGALTVDRGDSPQPVSRKTSTRPCERTVCENKLQETAEPQFGQSFSHHGAQEQAPGKDLAEGDAHCVFFSNACNRVKEELLDFEIVNAKWEMEEESGEESTILWPSTESSTLQGCKSVATSPGRTVTWSMDPSDQRKGVRGAAAVDQPPISTRLSSREKMQRYRARIRADPEKYQAYREMNRRRYHMRKKSISELPEQCQRLMREAWREAARRHRERKRSAPLSASLPTHPPSDCSGLVSSQLRNIPNVGPS